MRGEARNRSWVELYSKYARLFLFAVPFALPKQLLHLPDRHLDGGLEQGATPLCPFRNLVECGS